MSKQNPNQDFYKIGGRSQSDGPDRDATQEPRQSLPKGKGRERPRGREGDPNFIPGEAPVGQSKKR